MAMISNKGQIMGTEAQRAYALAGKAVFTLQGLSDRYTYSVRRAPGSRPGQPTVYFVAILAGRDNEADYQYLGGLFPQSNGQDADGQRRAKYVYRHGVKSRFPANSPSEVAFAWSWDRIERAVSLAPAQFYHEGRCGRCGRTLTVPESVMTGFGPECAGKR